VPFFFEMAIMSRLTRYIGKRLLQMLLLLVCIICINFVLINTAPGDPALALAGHQPGVTPEVLARIRQEFGLDKSVPERLAIYLGKIVRLDFGYSYSFRRPVLDIIAERIPATLILMVPSMFLGVLVGTAMGAIGARRQGSKLDTVLTTVNIGLSSLPVFWLGMVLILVFALTFHLLPVGGMLVAGPMTGIEGIVELLRHLALPLLTEFILIFPSFYLLARPSVIEVLREDFITTFRAAGLSDNAILYKHALRNAILPEVTAAGLVFGFLLSGTVLTETVFSWPGLGRLTYDAALIRDYPLLMGIFIVASAWFIIVNLGTDILYLYLDPRVVYK
jgi:peptide/nickel transport system permease protein